MIAPIAAVLALTLQGPRDPMLVTSAWLAEHAHDANLVVLQVGMRATYDTAHIAGARFIGFSDIEAPRDSTKPAMELPTPAALDSSLEALGLSDDSRIVIVYQSNGWLTPATRVYLTLYWAGLGARTSLLDGGLAAWQARGGGVTSAATPPVPRGHLTLHPRGDAIVTADWVAAHLNDPHVTIVDARNEQFYLGNYVADAGEPRPGHIPGAWNIPYSALLSRSGSDSGLVRSVEWLRTTFEATHTAPGDTIVAYCHIGMQATAIWFGAKLAGYTVRLYDGSFTEWSHLMQHPVERP